MSKGAIIDAEIVALHEKGRASFHLLGAYDINQQRPPIFLYAFDLLQLNGEDLKSFPWSSGKRALQKRISKPPVKFDISGPWEMTRSRFLKRRENLV
jgi:bifunctional non-homologous end joining protein LigD